MNGDGIDDLTLLRTDECTPWNADTDEEDATTSPPPKTKSVKRKRKFAFTIIGEERMSMRYDAPIKKLLLTP